MLGLSTIPPAAYLPDPRSGRFDDPLKEYRTLYCARHQSVALRESLQEFRHSTETLSKLKSVYGAVGVPPAQVPNDWRAAHVLEPARIRLASGSELVGYEEPGLLRALEAGFTEFLDSQNITSLDIPALRSKGRIVSQLFGRFLYSQGDRARSVAIEAGLLLYEVLNRAGLPDYTEIPGEAEVERGELRAWRVPRTEISIARVEEDDRAGEFLFSPQTVARALEFYERVKHLPQKTDYPPATYEEYVTRPDFRLPYLWADELPAWAKERVLRNPVWKWLAVLVALTVGVLASLLVYRIGGGWDKRFGRQGGQWRLGTLVFATSLVVMPLAFEFLLERVIGLRFEVQAVISKCMFALAFSAAVFALFALFEFIAEVLIGLRQIREKSVNAHLIRVTNRILGIVASIFLVIEATNYLGFALTPVLAGLGIGGLAVALATRPTLENIIGGFTLFADKPVRVGDFCRFGDETGTVEEIGLRSTRIRKLNDVVVSVPNADFSQMQLQNYTRMRTRLYRTTLALRYETTPEQLRYVLAKLRAMLLGHPKVSPDQLHVRFLSFSAYSLDLEIFAYTRTRDWLTFRAICEDINLRIMDIIKEAGTGFAFPSQTNYFVRDGGLDAERGREAETQVEHWRLKGKLPFPEFEPAEREQLEDNLDYPVEGSPEHRPRKSMSDTAPKSDDVASTGRR